MLYTKSQNNYIARPKDNPKDLIELEIGDTKQPDFKPQKKWKRWDNEVNVSVRLVHDEKTPTFHKDGEKIIWQGAKRDAHMYDIDPCDEHPEGASEFEIILKEKPDTNVVQFTVVDKGVDYLYQPEITDEEAQRVIDNTPEGQPIPTLLEMKRQMRPENVVGSYAIYAKEQKTNYVGGKEYKTGKVGHIYRPRIEDANGDWVYGDLNIDKGLLTVTIPQEFLDNAVYPVRHAAGLTFGYTTLGSVYFFTNTNNGGGGVVGTLAVDALISSISLGTTDNLSNEKTFITDTSYNIISGSIQLTDTTVGSWNISNYSTPFSLVSGTYYICYIGNAAITYRKIFMDTSGGSTNSRLIYSGNNFTSPTSPLANTNPQSNQLLSIYATYTAGGGGGTNMQVNIGDVWKVVSGVQINISDVWKPVTKAQINISDTWKTIF